MLTPAAAAARMASEPECPQVPSPIFWKTWPRVENGASPIQFAPSPPICVKPSVRRSIQSAM